MIADWNRVVQEIRAFAEITEAFHSHIAFRLVFSIHKCWQDIYRFKNHKQKAAEQRRPPLATFKSQLRGDGKVGDPSLRFGARIGIRVQVAPAALANSLEKGFALCGNLVPL